MRLRAFTARPPRRPGHHAPCRTRRPGACFRSKFWNLTPQAEPPRTAPADPDLLPALAQLTAPLLAARRGLLATMLLPHTVANLLLACIPFAPDLATAVVLLLLRQTVSKIDVPARQAFTAAVVPPGQRTAAAGMTSLARGVAVSVAPIAATTMLTGTLAALGAPLLLGAALGLGYDLALWRAYRGVPLS
ncbi:hypothetical protein [Nonomuraea sp. NPDC001831]|uniref:hypothetical protein n=1 Tax=Nonomuraea sp. NPDC001831 TaxID=3364340 RepID=UPI0036BABE96